MKSLADMNAALELELYIENEYSLVGADNSIGKAIERNQNRHMKAGRWNLAQATIGYMHLVDAGAKAYCQAFGGTVAGCFNKSTRMLVAARFAEGFRAEYQIQNP